MNKTITPLIVAICLGSISACAATEPQKPAEFAISSDRVKEFIIGFSSEENKGSFIAEISKRKDTQIVGSGPMNSIIVKTLIVYESIKNDKRVKYVHENQPLFKRN